MRPMSDEKDMKSAATDRSNTKHGLHHTAWSGALGTQEIAFAHKEHKALEGFVTLRPVALYIFGMAALHIALSRSNHK